MNPMPKPVGASEFKARHLQIVDQVPTAVRDEVSRLAEQRGTTMLEVVTDAVHRLGRDEHPEGCSLNTENR